jgi:peroxiredoxin
MNKFCATLLTVISLFLTANSAGAQGTKSNDKNAAQEIIKLEGQVVCCEDCWAEADRAKVEYGTAEDLLKAKSCIEGGDPTLLAVRENVKFTLYQLEQGKFKLSEKNWYGYVGKKIAVTGEKKKNKKTNVFVIDTLEILENSIAERDAQAALGKEIELKLKDLFGAEASLSQYKGRIVVLNFWATYCVPCRKEMPDLAAIQNEYAALGVQVIGASTDESAERSKVLQFIKETKINFPIWMGATGADMIRFGLGEALPGTVVIDRTGKIVKVISGVVNVTDLKKQIDSMLQVAESGVKKDEIVSQTVVEEKPKKVSNVPS